MCYKIKAFGEVVMRLHVPGYRKLEQTHTLDVSYSGTGVNVLSALHRFGHKTGMWTILPQNSLGDAAVAYLQSLGISTDEVIRNGEHLGMYFLEEGFGLRSTKVTYSSREISSFNLLQDEDGIYLECLDNVDMLHFCGISLATSPAIQKRLVTLAKVASEFKTIVVFDCNYRPKLWKDKEHLAKTSYEQMLYIADVCFMTVKDAIYLLGLSTSKKDPDEQLRELIPKVSEKFNIGVIAGTIRKRGKDGRNYIQGYLYQKNTFCYSKVYELAILDRIGGGDGFASGIMHGVLEELSAEDMVEFAMASGVLAHTTYGDSPVNSLKEVRALVRQVGSDIER